MLFNDFIILITQNFFLYLYRSKFLEPNWNHWLRPLQFLQYRHNIWLRWSKFNTMFQHPHNFSRFSLNLSGGMLTGQHQMISGNRVFSFYVFFCYRKHILYQKCAFPAVIQFDNMDNVARFPCFFLFLHKPSIFINAAGQWYHPVYPGTCILKTVIMSTIPRLISFEIWALII